MEAYYSKKDLINAKNNDTNYIYDLTDLEEFLEYVPTADVVPRDEVAKIFEAIEKSIFELETPYQTLHCIPSGFIEELKEKYTKGGEGE